MQSKKCLKCGRCCQTPGDEEYSVIIFPSDLERIAKCLDLTKKEFVNKYCNKHLLQTENNSITLYMLKSVGKRCVFLTSQNLCYIYKDRPFQCKNAPYNFFAKMGIWENMPCLDQQYLAQCDSSENDRKMIEELMMGYG